MGMHAGSKGDSPPSKLRANIPWSLGCFLLETCSFPCAGDFQQPCIVDLQTSLHGFLFSQVVGLL
ncbi:unnamed protein product [Prunus armeniaca]